MKKLLKFFLVIIIIESGFLNYDLVNAMPVRRGADDKKIEKMVIKNYKEKIVRKIEYREIIKKYPMKNRGIVNILLVGVDSKNSNKGRSDAMMILTIDKYDNNMRLTSLMRDTYVKIYGHGKEKLNHSYAYGGIKLLQQTIEDTFKIEIDNYAIVNFNGFEEVVEIIGGVEVNVDEDELPIVNVVLEDKITEVGQVILNGKGALQYARIRKVGNGSYGRTFREREVLENLSKKVKRISILKYPALIKTIMKCVTTDIGFSKTLDYGYWVSKSTGNGLEKLQIPATNKSEGVLLPKKGWVLKMDEIYNIKLIKKFIYGK